MIQAIQIQQPDEPCCANPNLVTTKGITTCTSCGMTFERYYDPDDGYLIRHVEGYDKRTAKQYIALGRQLDNATGLGSYIDFFKCGYFNDIDNIPLRPDKQKLFYRLKFTRDYRSQVGENPTEYRVIKVMKDVTQSLNILPDIRKRAVYLYYKVTIKSHVAIINHVSLMATCIYLAMKETKYRAPVTIQELCDCFNRHGHRINARMIYRDILTYKKLTGAKNAKRSDNKAYIPKIMSQLAGYPPFKDYYSWKVHLVPLESYITKISKITGELIDALPKRVATSRNPHILDAASVYAADIILARQQCTKRALTQDLLAEATGIATYSIRDNFTMIKRYLDVSIARE